MNNDNELLKLAAKAVGIELHHWCGDTFIRVSEYVDDAGGYWNPLTDDGDALRLAVKLGIEPRQATNMASALFPIESPSRFAVCNENHGDDPYAATRRCIVRAAAAIGESLDGNKDSRP